MNSVRSWSEHHTEADPGFPKGGQTQKWGTDLFCHFPWKFRENKENSTRGAHWIFYYVDPPLPFQLSHSGSAIVQELCQGLEILEMNNFDVPCLATISKDNCTTSFCGSLWRGVSLCTKRSRSIFFILISRLKRQRLTQQSPPLKT